MPRASTLGRQDKRLPLVGPGEVRPPSRTLVGLVDQARALVQNSPGRGDHAPLEGPRRAACTAPRPSLTTPVRAPDLAQDHHFFASRASEPKADPSPPEVESAPKDLPSKVPELQREAKDHSPPYQRLGPEVPGRSINLLNRLLSDLHRPLNDWLRTGETSCANLLSDTLTPEQVPGRVDEMDQALNDMPNHRPCGIPMARWTTLPPSEIARFEAAVGTPVVLDEGYGHFSANPVKAGGAGSFGDYVGGLDVKFLVRPREVSNARDVRAVRAREEEVIFPRGSRVIPLSVTRDVEFQTPPYVMSDGKVVTFPPIYRTVIELAEAD